MIQKYYFFKKNIETIQQTNYKISNVKLIRPYYVSKLNVIHKGFQLINNFLIFYLLIFLLSI